LQQASCSTPGGTSKKSGIGESFSLHSSPNSLLLVQQKRRSSVLCIPSSLHSVAVPFWLHFLWLSSFVTCCSFSCAAKEAIRAAGTVALSYLGVSLLFSFSVWCSSIVWELLCFFPCFASALAGSLCELCFSLLLNAKADLPFTVKQKSFAARQSGIRPCAGG
jgi:hypothetical protein